MRRLLRDLRPFLSTIWIFVAPLLLSPILFYGTKEAKCIFSICLCTLYWIGEVVPIAVTSMLPLVLFPAFGIMSTNETSQQYLKDTTMLFVVTLIAAIAVEECQLHRRIALNVLSHTSGRFTWSLAAFSVATAFISFWMVDTAATALMIPIAIAALEEMGKGDEEEGSTQTSVTEIGESHIGPDHGHVGKLFDGLSRRDRGMWKCMVLVCGHASLIGGTGTITATGPNLIFRDNIQTWYPEGQTGVTYLSWMAFALPPLVGYLIASWIILQVVFLGPRSLLEIVRSPKGENSEKAEKMNRAILNAKNSLGPMT
ncbi:hypothetical protein L596_018773 [Steinernema carpocapsae]|uniref:Citrate transporter-like domain-containing protein n=1 Tax=Steinernema carpocapsae TaxID=34508 RepID=A0A4U5N648_STECR|nr:hypothetical protein L596_018773 [Steinernema carpocapsae]